jgi:cysteine synthase A
MNKERSALVQNKEFREAVEGIGSTSLIEIKTPPQHGRIFAKCEWENPGGTIKDRVAMAMIGQLVKEGLNREQDTVLEYSGGQLAMSLAAICQKLDVDLVVTLGDFTAEEDLKKIEAMGARVCLSDKHQGFWGVMELAFDLAERNPSWKFLYQHKNTANLRVHETTTAAEIINQIPVQRLDAWVAAIGTGGTLIGTGNGLRSAFPHVKLFGVTPAEMPYATLKKPHAIPKFVGSGGLGEGRQQFFVETAGEKACEHLNYDYDACKNEMLRFYNETNMRIGSSAAACLLAARKLAEDGGPDFSVALAFASAGAPSEWRTVTEGATDILSADGGKF